MDTTELKPIRHSNGGNWIRANFPQLPGISLLGEAVADLLNEWAAGIYHLDSQDLGKVDWVEPRFLKFRLRYTRLSTWDFSDLTRLVFLAHDYCLRIEVIPLSRQAVELMFHPRTRSGDMAQRHPTLEEAVAMHRTRYPQTDSPRPLFTDP